MELQTKIGRQIESLLSKSESIYGRLTDKKTKDRRDVISVDFTPTSLCQYREYDIRNTEPIIIFLGEGIRPTVFSNREDFPITAHQNPASNGYRELCLFDLTYEELKPLLDGSYLLRQIDDWLCKTASNELHETTQPIEPYFMNTDGIVVFTERMRPIFYLSPCVINGRNYYIQQKQASSSVDFIIIAIPFSIDVETDNVIHPLPQTLKDLFDYFPKNNFEDEIIKKLLAVETNLPDKSIINRARILLSLLITKTMKDDTSRSAVEIRCVLTKTNVGQMRRLLGMDIAHPEARNPSDIGIELYGCCNEFNRSFAAMYNGVYDHPALKINILQIGVGAIGSQVFGNCVKAGFGEWTLVDNDIFLPHNVARHKLDVGYFGNYKSDLLAAWLKGMYQDQEMNAKNSSHPIDVLNPNNKETVLQLIQNTDIILDTAASPAVSKSLAIDYEHNKRIISFFMNPSGSSAIALIEDKERTCRLDTIEYEYFKRLVDAPEHANHFKRTDEVYYSTSCRDRSAIISQDLVAAFSALCSKKLKNALASEHAEVLIWTEEEDGIIIDKFTPAQYISHEIADRDGTIWTVFISNELKNEIDKARKAAEKVETGGVLVGGIDKFRNILYIVKNIPAPDDSIHAPTSYIRGCKGLPEKMENVRRLTHSMLGYIGEWHSHPSSDTRKSAADIILHDSMKDFASSNCSPAVMIIAGNGEYSLYI